MIPFATFEFAPQTQRRRNKALSEVMPIGITFKYFLLLSDAYLTSNGDEHHVSDFDDLTKVLGCENDLQELQLARKEGRVTEGKHALPVPVAGYLIEASVDPPLVRRWMFGDSKPAITTVELSSIIDQWAELEFEEIEVGDLSGKWYFRAKDDDPLIFLAVSDGKLLDRIRRCNKFCREVRGDFLYAF